MIGRDRKERGVKTFAGVIGKQSKDRIARRYDGGVQRQDLRQEIARKSRQAATIIGRQFRAGVRERQHIIDEVVDAFRAKRAQTGKLAPRGVSEDDNATAASKRVWAQASNGMALVRFSITGNERTQGNREIVVNGGDGLRWPRNARGP